MKKITHILLILVAMYLVSCSGSDTYRGHWKATDNDGLHYDISFKANRFNIRNEQGEITHFNYTQNTINITNSIETYGIQLDDGRNCQINFPIPDDESVGIITDGIGNILYTISRDKYINSNEILN